MLIAGERVQVKPASTFLLFKLNKLHKETRTNRQNLSEAKPWSNDRGVLNLHHDNDVNRIYNKMLARDWFCARLFAA